MNDSLIWLHDDALRATHPVFRAAPADTPAVYIWDDAYLQFMEYSLKRLVFLYETLCELPLGIVQGTAHEVLSGVSATRIFVPATLNPRLRSVADQLRDSKTVIVVEDEPFVILEEDRGFSRFAQYWKRAEKTALLPDGDINA